MELKECPSCGSLAGTHVERCKFCGADLPRGEQATVVAPENAPVARPSGDPDPDPDPDDRAPRAGHEPGAAPDDLAPPGSVTADAGAPGPGPTIERQVQGPVADESFARSRIAGTPMPIAPTRPARRSVARRVGSVVSTVVLVVVSFAIVRAITSTTVDAAESDVLAGKGEWITFVDPDGAFTIELPSEPFRDEHGTYEDGTKRVIDGNVGEVRYLIEYWDPTGGSTTGAAAENRLEQMPDILVSWTGGTSNVPMRTTVGGLPALQFDVDAGDRKWSGTGIVTGRRVFLIAIGGPGTAVGAYDRMASSFHPIDPNR